MNGSGNESGARRAPGEGDSPSSRETPLHGSTAREHEAEFRFYEELNDFLAPHRRKRAIVYRFRGSPSVKDAIEAQGVPHAEVDLIIVARREGETDADRDREPGSRAEGSRLAPSPDRVASPERSRSVGFDYRLRPGDRVAVYPVFESLDITPITRLQDRPLRRTRFILDVHLGKLARLLRLLGFDTAYDNRWDDRAIVRRAQAEHRVILTRDRRLLMIGSVTHGYWIRSDDPEEQARAVLRRFDLRGQTRLFTRCPVCNGSVAPVAKAEIEELLEPKTRLYYQEFRRCAECGRIYWAGSHHGEIRRRMERILADSPEEPASG